MERKPPPPPPKKVLVSKHGKGTYNSHTLSHLWLARPAAAAGGAGPSPPPPPFEPVIDLTDDRILTVRLNVVSSTFLRREDWCSVEIIPIRPHVQEEEEEEEEVEITGSFPAGRGSKGQKRKKKGGRKGEREGKRDQELKQNGGKSPYTTHDMTFRSYNMT